MKIRTHLIISILLLSYLIAPGLWGQTSTAPQPTQALSPKGFTIDGHITDIPDGTSVYLYDIEEQVVLDSALSEQGNFRLNGKVSNPKTCWIKCDGEYAIIQLENVDFTFEATHEDMHLNSHIQGGPEQVLQNELQALQRPWDAIYYGALDSLMQQQYSGDEQKRQLVERFRRAQATSQAIYIDFGIAHPHAFLGLDIIYRNRKSIPRDTLEYLYTNLPPRLQKHEKGRALRTFLYETTAEKGQLFIDFTAKTIDGKNFQLSALKGKYIYLSFWSAGCGPCRMENRFLSEHYDRIPEDLAIVSFSVDRNPEVWAKATAQDGIIWYNVSDREGGQGKVKTQYQVQAIPTSFLIDTKGRIVEIFTGFDPSADLLEEIAAIMEHHK